MNRYNYCVSNPINFVDSYGLFARTYGPITIIIPTGESESIKQAERAHEAQHRQDWKNKLPLPPWKKEQRGWAAEIPVLKKQIKELKAKQNLTQREKEKLKEAETELYVAESIANSDYAAKDYYNRTKRSWQKRVE